MNVAVTAKPINQTNAIEAVGFMLSFARKLTQNEIDRLLGLESVFKDELPVFSKLAGFGVTIENNQVTQRTSQFSGVMLQKLASTPGKFSWIVQINEDTLHVTCGEYDRWVTVLPKALKYINKICAFLDLDTLQMASVGCQFIDKFVYENVPQFYVLNDVFMPDSGFLPSSVKDAGDLWHVYQGWFGVLNTVVDARPLNQLNLTSSVIDGKLAAIIEHNTQISFGKSVTVKTFIEQNASSISLLENLLTDIHNTNKQILKKLLAESKLQAIGLT